MHSSQMLNDTTFRSFPRMAPQESLLFSFETSLIVVGLMGTWWLGLQPPFFFSIRPCYWEAHTYSDIKLIRQLKVFLGSDRCFATFFFFEGNWKFRLGFFPNSFTSHYSSLQRNNILMFSFFFLFIFNVSFLIG